MRAASTLTTSRTREKSWVCLPTHTRARETATEQEGQGSKAHLEGNNTKPEGAAHSAGPGTELGCHLKWADVGVYVCGVRDLWD